MSIQSLVRKDATERKGDIIGYNGREWDAVRATSGTATIASGATTAVVSHNLGVVPGVENIIITFNEQGTSDYGRWWVDTITRTQFTLNVSADPGASNLTFGWMVIVLP